MSNISSDPYLTLAFWTAVGAVLFTLGIGLFIAGLRVQRTLRERREQRFQQRWRPLLLQAMVGEAPARLPSLGRRERWLFLKLWNHLQESVRGESALHLGEIARRLDCATLARHLLRSRSLTRRLFAILTLGHMRERSAWDLLEQQLLHADSTCSLYAARALIQLDRPRGVRVVIPQLLLRDDWEMIRVAILLQEFREALGTELAGRLVDLPQDRMAHALQLAAALQLRIPSVSLRPWLQPDQPADLLRIALRLTDGPEVLDEIRQLAGHEDWRVRVQAAHALGRLGQATDLAVLTRLLTDAQWWVRYRAAQALTRLPFVTREQLHGLLDTLQDRYAREMYTQVFAELKGARP
ncbi:MAG: HEAT repeat domain-containing protein [Hylemonella sp.]|uniref:HEAT repeat domain-containing protein n=1 Tax=Hylemonella sp. TaxID=2066020 RepID=UPI0022C33AEE|nr:HEAT repeat domain-containing protein [Hylemonella sp.]MCZ8252986.1 HEAT repeat domain-containing protein [Hylemonella sp.]